MIKCSITAGFESDARAEFVLNELYRSIILAEEYEFDEDLLKRYLPIFNEICKNWKFYAITNYMHGLLRSKIFDDDEKGDILMRSAAIDIGEKIKQEDFANDSTFLFYYAITNYEDDPDQAAEALEFVIQQRHPLGLLERLNRILIDGNVDDYEILTEYINFSKNYKPNFDYSCLIKRTCNAIEFKAEAIERLDSEESNPLIAELYLLLAFSIDEYYKSIKMIIDTVQESKNRDIGITSKFGALKALENPNIKYIDAIEPVWPYTNCGEVLYLITKKYSNACDEQNALFDGVNPSQELALNVPVYPFFCWWFKETNLDLFKSGAAYLLFLLKNRMKDLHYTVSADLNFVFTYLIESHLRYSSFYIVEELYKIDEDLVAYVLDDVFMSRIRDGKFGYSDWLFIQYCKKSLVVNYRLSDYADEAIDQSGLVW